MLGMIFKIIHSIIYRLWSISFFQKHHPLLEWKYIESHLFSYNAWLMFSSGPTHVSWWSLTCLFKV